MSHYFTGDLCQMGAQRRLLSDYGFNVIMSNIYPTVETEEEYKEALSLIWTIKCEGWWHYKEDYIKYKICTLYDFWTNLAIQTGKGEVYLYHFVSWEDIRNNKVKLNNISVIDAYSIINRGDKITVNDNEFIVE